MNSPRLKQDYEERIIPAIMERFQLKNRHQAPKLTKIVVNMGVGDAIQNAKLMDAAVADLTLITGQRPSIRRSKKAIS